VRVAYTVSLLGDCASARGDLQTAEAQYKRAADIYRSAVGKADPHTAAAESNLGNVYLKESKYALAEQTLHEVDNSIGAASPQSLVTAVARGRWGRALLALKRYPEAEAKLTSAHEIMKAQQKLAPDEYKNICSSLVSLYLATNQPDKAKLYRSELSSGPAER
jgi:tetratricopeptide (TPR) repeat protein